MRYFFVLIITGLVVCGIVPLVRKVALRRGVLDLPGEPRKIHAKPTPLLGGLAIWFGFFIVLWCVALGTPFLLNSSITVKHLIGLTLGGLILMIGGYLDDAYHLRPSRQIIFPILAALAVIASGIGARVITNPFGGTISLVSWEKVLFWFDGVGYRFTFPSDIFTFVWLLIMMYTTKLLDGLDGLVSGLGAIGASMVLLFTTMTRWYQREVGMLAALAAGAFAGFIPWNFHPAKIFLGEGGSLFVGFMLGTLAIISGGKIAIALLVLGVPVLDTLWVTIRRVFFEKKSLAVGDRMHLHFRLLDAGLSHRGAVLLLWGISVVFGAAALFLQSKEKLLALGVLSVVMVGLGAWTVLRYRAHHSS